MSGDGKIIGVIGLGYVGLPLLMAISGGGFTGLGFDNDARRIDCLDHKKSYLKTITDEEVEMLAGSGRFSATVDMERLEECDAIIICVPTPLNKNREPDLSHVISATKVIASHLRPGQLVILESTTFPGTTEEIIRPILETSGLECGRDFYLAYSPERENPGNIDFSTSTIPKVVGGLDKKSTGMAAALYGGFIEQVVTVSSAKTAEAVKLTENIFRAVNIGLVNELKMIFQKMDINMFEVVDIAKTKPFGFMPFYPGPGWGGHCIPVDPFYLLWKAREFGVPAKFIELVGEVNDAMPEFVVKRTIQVLKTHARKKLKGASVLVIGVAYKADVDDIRESPSIRVINKLKEKGARVSYHDPLIPEFENKLTGLMKSGNLDQSALSSCDIVIICTHHSAIDWDFVVLNARLIVDTRNATKNVIEYREKIYMA